MMELLRRFFKNREYRAGYKAGSNGLGRGVRPYAFGHMQERDWDRGFSDGCRDALPLAQKDPAP